MRGWYQFAPMSRSRAGHRPRRLARSLQADQGPLSISVSMRSRRPHLHVHDGVRDDGEAPGSARS